MFRPTPRAAVAALLLLASACIKSPIEWTTDRSTPLVSDSARVLAPDGTLHPDSMLALAASINPPSSDICPGTLRLSRAGGSLYAAWWRVRPDSSATLLSSRSLDSGRHCREAGQAAARAPCERGRRRSAAARPAYRGLTCA